ncbi:MAG: ATP-dependent helicase [Candidatus Sumerlaeia bacterium]
MSDFLSKLNPSQREAVANTDGPLLIIAGAGSGKTRVITHRIAYLISEKNVAPWKIFAATFTNKAAREMKERVMSLCGVADTARLSIATFHSQCAQILRREATNVGLTERYNICDATDQVALLRSCIDELGYDKKAMKPWNVQEIISLAKMALLEGEEAYAFIKKRRSKKYADIYTLYQERLRESDAVDFDDLLLLTVRLWRENPDVLARYQERYQYVLVDEYQDTNLAQFEVVRLLVDQHHNLCVVGDEDQSIYSWRGAEITNLLEFEKRFPEAKIVRLEQNYRSKGNILAAAHSVIERNTQRLGKELWTQDDPGDPIIVIEGGNESDEANRIAREIKIMHSEGMPYEEIALFYRVNALSRVYEEALRQADIPYRVIGGVRFYDRAEIKDILAYMQLVDNPFNMLALMRVINKPRRGIGDKALSNLLYYARENNLPLFRVLLSEDHLKAAGLKGKALKEALVFAKNIEGWSAKQGDMKLRNLAQAILNETQFEASLGDPKSLEVMSRIENIKEFLGALEQYEEQEPEPSLRKYLEMIALRGADEGDAEEPGVSLMTVHNAKGLEFDVVFIVALEKDLFPNARAVREQKHYEEERRLFYVALTRGRQRVYCSHAVTRRLYGQMEWPSPSRFLMEIAPEYRLRYDDAELGKLETTRVETPQAEAAFPDAGHAEAFPPDMEAPGDLVDEGMEDDDSIPF